MSVYMYLGTMQSTKETYDSSSYCVTSLSKEMVFTTNHLLEFGCCVYHIRIGPVVVYIETFGGYSLHLVIHSFGLLHIEQYFVEKAAMPRRNTSRVIAKVYLL